MGSKKKKYKGLYRLPLCIALTVILAAAIIGYCTLPQSSTSSVQEVKVSASITDDHTTTTPSATDSIKNSTERPTLTSGDKLEQPILLTPRSQQTITHLGYTVGYNHNWRLPNWVAYELTAAEVFGETPRTDKFLPDPMVKGDPVETNDYRGSGYDRGHMAPAADMRWSAQAMKESFYMTNICPQNHSNNAGDWKDLEELVRDLAVKYHSIYICCGPIVSDAATTIGTERKIVVPQAFYKVLLRRKSNQEWTAIGFIMPNAAGNRPLMTYMCSVDDVEKSTEINFFHRLPDSIESSIERDFTVADWTI